MWNATDLRTRITPLLCVITASGFGQHLPGCLFLWLQWMEFHSNNLKFGREVMPSYYNVLLAP